SKWPVAWAPPFLEEFTLHKLEHAIDSAAGFLCDFFRNLNPGLERFEGPDHFVQRDGLHERTLRLRIDRIELAVRVQLSQTMKNPHFRSHCKLFRFGLLN